MCKGRDCVPDGVSLICRVPGLVGWNLRVPDLAGAELLAGATGLAGAVVLDGAGVFSKEGV
jgi:hypothetical protein